MNIFTNFIQKFTDSIVPRNDKKEKTDLDQKIEETSKYKLESYDKFRETVIQYSSSKENLPTEDLILFFSSNTTHLSKPFSKKWNVDQDVDLGKAISKLSEQIKLAKPEEVETKNSKISNLVKKLDVFAETRQVPPEESQGIPVDKNSFSIIMEHLGPEEFQAASFVSKEWRSFANDPLTIIKSINEHPEIPIKEYGFKTVESFIEFAEKYKRIIFKLNFHGMGINDDQLEKIVDTFPFLTELNIGNPGLSIENVRCISEKGLDQLQKLKKLEKLNVSGNEVRDDGMKCIGELRNLKELNILNCLITDEGMVFLKKLEKLEELSTNEITDNEIVFIEQFKNLKYLDLGIFSVGITNRGLEIIGKFTNLEHLYLGKVENVDLNLIRDLTNLRTLRFRGDKNVTDDHLACLENMIHLKELCLFDCPITGKGLSHLVKGNLKKLNFYSCENINDKGFAEIGKFENLQDLSFDDCSIQDKDFIHFRKLFNLERLVISGDYKSSEPKPQGKGFTHLEGLKNLKDLHLYFCLKPNLGIPFIGKISGLERLVLYKCGITDEEFSYLDNLNNLKELRILSCGEITGNVLTHLKDLPSCKTLKTLDLSGLQTISDNLIDLEKFTGLHELDLSHTKINNDGLVHLEKLTELQNLNLSHTKINNDGLVHLEKLKKLQTLNIDGCEMTAKNLKHLIEKLKRLHTVKLPFFSFLEGSEREAIEKLLLQRSCPSQKKNSK